MTPIAELINSSTTASPKKLMVGPNASVQLKASAPPATKLGMVAQQISQQATITALSIAVTSAYARALMESSCPPVNFTTVPPGMSQSNLAPLQASFNQFQSQFNSYQSNASIWTTRNPNTEALVTQLSAIPTSISNIQGTVSTYFTTLAALQPGTPAYADIMNELVNEIGSQYSPVNNLVNALQPFAQNLNNAANTLVSSAQGGILSQLVSAYNADIQAFNTAIDNANNQISNYNSKISENEKIKAASIAADVIGVLNWWNPIGWAIMAGGAVGTGLSVSEINSLNEQIGSLRTSIGTYTDNVGTDQGTAMLITALCIQAQQFASMNSAAQQELTALQNLFISLGADINNALNDLNSNDLTDAQTEWNTILADVQYLQNLTIYTWPGPANLTYPNPFAAVGSDIYGISTSGEMYHYSASSNAWTDMGVKALSVAGQGSAVYAIDGAPQLATSSNNQQSSSYLVKSYNMSNNSWTNIADIPFAAIACGGLGLFAIAQKVSDRGLYMYSGSGTAWNRMPDLPGSDAPSQIAVTNSSVFAISNNSQFLYQLNSTSKAWQQVGTFNCISITANGNKVGIIDSNSNAYVYDAGTNTLTSLGVCVADIAQINDGTQFRISTLNTGLWYANPNVNPATFTYLTNNAVSVFSSDTNLAYYADNQNNIWKISANGQTNELPALPS